MCAMAFVKLDCGTLDSSLWPDQEACRIFFAALMMAAPKRFFESHAQLQVDSIIETGFIVPPGFYGFVEAAGVGIVRRALMDEAVGLAALKRLGDPEESSRSSKYDGRRMVRVNGGYVILNYWDYRVKDHTAAVRQKRYRTKKAVRKSQKQVQAAAESRESRAAKEYNDGNNDAGDRITAEDLP